MSDRARLEELKTEMMGWVEGTRSWTNLQSEVYTPDVIAIMDAQEVVKRAAAIQALAALISREDKT